MLDEFNRPLWPRLKRKSNHLILDPRSVTRPIDRLREMEARSRGGPLPTRIETDWWIRSCHFASLVDRTPMGMIPFGLLGLSSSGSILASAAARSRVEAIRPCGSSRQGSAPKRHWLPSMAAAALLDPTVRRIETAKSADRARPRGRQPLPAQPLSSPLLRSPPASNRRNPALYT